MFTTKSHYRQILTTGLLAMALLTCGGSIQAQTDQPKPKVITLNVLSMEVNALQTLNQLRLDKNQLEKLQKWAEEMAPKEQHRKPAKVSSEYREKLIALRKALQEAKDADLIAKLNEEINVLFEKEKPTLDDRVEISEAAGKRVQEALRLLKPGQMAAYLGQIADSVNDPIDQYLDALEEARALNEEDWKEQRDELVEAICRAVVGLDETKVKRMSGQLIPILTKARGMTKGDFQKQAGDFEAAGRKIIGEISPEIVLRHQVEFDLATLMSNPRTPQACRALARASEGK